MQEIKYVSLDLLKPHPENPRTIDKNQFKILCDSITKNKDYFETRPILVNPQMVIFAGNMRYLAAKEVGMTEVPVAVMDISEERQKELMIRDNRQNGEWNWDMLAGYDKEFLKDMGFENTELDKGFGINVGEDNFMETPKAEPATQKGELFILGTHRLMCGDSTSREDVLKLMDGQQANLLFTDPPYGVDYLGSDEDTKHDKIENDNLTGKNLVGFLTNCLMLAFEVMAPDACFYVWHATSTAKEFTEAIEASKFAIHQTLIWLKSRFSLTRADFQHIYEPCFYGWKDGETHYTDKTLRSYSNVLNLDKETFAELLDVWYVERDALAKYEHPTQKPVKLAERAIHKSCAEGGIVLDVFAGSGSTLMACQQLNRRAFCMELEPKYCDLICQRFFEFTGVEAVRVSDGKKWSEIKLG